MNDLMCHPVGVYAIPSLLHIFFNLQVEQSLPHIFICLTRFQLTHSVNILIITTMLC